MRAVDVPPATGPLSAAARPVPGLCPGITRRRPMHRDLTPATTQDRRLQVRPAARRRTALQQVPCALRIVSSTAFQLVLSSRVGEECWAKPLKQLSAHRRMSPAHTNSESTHEPIGAVCVRSGLHAAVEGRRRQGLPSAVPYRGTASTGLLPSNKSSRPPRSRRQSSSPPTQAVHLQRAKRTRR